jgi:hypothetical protein
VKFHQCVRLSRFESDRTISFIPPDGEFELMSYRLNTEVKPLIWCEAVIESHSGSRIEYMIKAKAQFKRRSSANNVEIIIPVPEDADTPRFKTTIGSCVYAPELNACVWKIKQFQVFPIMLTRKGRQRVLIASAFRSTECKKGKPGSTSTDQHQIRDPVFHGEWHTGTVLEGCG